MIAKAKLIGVLPAPGFPAAAPFEDVDVEAAVGGLGVVRVGRLQERGSGGKRDLCRAWPPVHYRADDYWESVSYVTLGLCGLIGIAVCLL